MYGAFFRPGPDVNKPLEGDLILRIGETKEDALTWARMMFGLGKTDRIWIFQYDDLTIVDGDRTGSDLVLTAF